MHIDDIQTDPEFEALFADTRLAGADLEHLRNKLLTEGFHDPLVLWRGVLLDGYTRLGICREECIEPAVRSVDDLIADRDGAIEWIRIHQHSRRNLDAKARALNIAEVYEGRKRRQGPSVQSGTEDHFQKTRDAVAAEFKVSPSTVKKAVEYKRGLDAIEAEEGAVAREEAAKNLPMKEVRKKGRKAQHEDDGAAEKQSDGEVAQLIAAVRKRLSGWSSEQRREFYDQLLYLKMEFK